MREGKDLSAGMFQRDCAVEEFFVVRNREAGVEEPGQLFGIHGQLTISKVNPAWLLSAGMTSGLPGIAWNS